MGNKKVQKLNQFFYMNSDGEILKYKNFVLFIIVKKLLLLIILEKKKYYIVLIIKVKLW